MQIKTAREIAAKHRSDKIVIVASRRTDMPAFYIDELITGLQQGIFHPQGMRQKMWELQFTPGDIHCVGLWSQDFGKWIKRRNEVKCFGYKFWYRFTILPDDPVCKPQAPPVKVQLDQLEKLVEIDGADCVLVFVDPLIQYRRIGERSWINNVSRQTLTPIIHKAKELGINSISTSILDYYKKVERRAHDRGVEFRFFDPQNIVDRNAILAMVDTFKEITDQYGLVLKTCCEKFLHSSHKTIQGACVDGNYLNTLFGPGASEKADSGQRVQYGCGCTAAVDIGRYQTHGEWSHYCGHHCIQCYAR